MSAIDRIMQAQTFDKGAYLPLADGRIPSDKEKDDAAKTAELLAGIKNGEFTLTIEKLGYKPNSPKIGEMIFAEFKVEATNTEKAPVGSKRSWVQKLSTAAGVSAYKSFLYAALGAETEDQKKAADKMLPGILAAIEQNQAHPLTGRKVVCSVQPHRKQDGNWVTINRYQVFKD